MLAEQDGIDAWDAPSAPPRGPSRPSAGGAGTENGLPTAAMADNTRRTSARTAAKKRPSTQTGTHGGGAAAGSPFASPSAADEVMAATVPTAATLPALRTSLASTGGPFGSPLAVAATMSSSVPSAADKKSKGAKSASGKKASSSGAAAATTTAKKKTTSTSRSSSTAGKAAKTKTAPVAKAPTKPKTAKPAAGKAAKSGSVRSASSASAASTAKPKKTGTSRASSVSGKSRTSTSAAGGANKKKSTTTTTTAAKRASSIGAGSTGTAKSKASTKKKGSTAAPAAGGAKKKTSRAGSSASKKGSVQVRRGTTMKKARASSRASTSLSSARSSRARSLGGSAGKKSRVTKLNVTGLLDAVIEQETDGRHVIEVDEEMERDGLQPLYNILVMEVVRTQVQQLNKRQRQFTETMELLKERGLRQSNVDGAENVEDLIDLLKSRLEGDATREVQQLRAENANLRERLEERTFEMDKKSSEMELLRMQLARQQTRGEVEKDALRAEVQSSLQSASLDVERMKKELGHRIDIACSTFRTPKYDTAMRAMQELVAEVQREVQEHHDTLSKLIVSIGAKDTFAKEEGDSMHTNLPGKYRKSLRALEKDRILNILDVLSFQEGVVTTIGKALYVLEETGHKTSVM